MSLQGKIFAAIMAERQFQDKKYGPILTPQGNQGPGGHELAAWTLIIEKELEEAKNAAIHGGFANTSGRNSIRAELIQVAAVCVAALEQHGLEE